MFWDKVKIAILDKVAFWDKMASFPIRVLRNQTLVTYCNVHEPPSLACYFCLMQPWTICLNANCRNLLGVLKISTNNEPKESTYYSITPLRHICDPKKPIVQTDGQFSVLEVEKPGQPYEMKYKVEFLTGTNNRNFYKDLEEMVSKMEHENEKFAKHTDVKRIVKIPYSYTMSEPRMFARIYGKYGCDAYELKGEMS